MGEFTLVHVCNQYKKAKIIVISLSTSAAQVNLIQEQESERLQMKLRDEEAQRMELSRQLETSRQIFMIFIVKQFIVIDKFAGLRIKN